MRNLQKLIQRATILILLFSGFQYLEANEIEQVVRKHLRGMKEKDYLNTYQMLSSKHFKNEISILEFKEFVDANTSFSRCSGYEVSDVDENGRVSVYLKNENNVQPLEYALVFEDGKWKIWSLALLEINDTTQSQVSNEKDQLIDPINRLFKDLSSNNLSHTYFGTSIEFQHATSFDTFKDFVFANEVLISHEMTLFEAAQIDDKRGRVKVNLQNTDELTPVDFDLTFQEGGWKITGIDVGEKVFDVSSTALSNVREVIEEQLAAIKRGNITKAYHFMAKKYRDSIPLEAYEQVVVENPNWKQVKNLQMTGSAIQFGVAEIEGTFESFDGMAFKAHYQLVNEDDSWKLSELQQVVQ